MTPSQRKMARHALGFDDGTVSYRNRYFVGIGSPQEGEWDDLCDRGLAVREKNGLTFAHFYLTEEGAREALDEGDSLCPEDFPGAAVSGVEKNNG